MKKEFKEQAAASLEAATLNKARPEPHRWGEIYLSDGTRLVWELCSCKGSFKCKSDLAYHWARNGWIKREGRDMFFYWNLSTYFYDKDGTCWGRFNPQIIKGQNKINFKWLLESTESNALKLLTKMIEMAEASLK